jgi:ABC-type Mn2+/Zn2+ transport system permease subunit
MSSFVASFTDFIAYDFLQLALIGTILMSIISGLISPIVIAKRYAFIGSAVSHSTLLGIALALSLPVAPSTLSVFIVTLIITLILSQLLAFAVYKQSLPSDSIIGIFFSVTMGAGIILYSLFAKDQAQLMSYLFGNILLLDSVDLSILVILTGSLVSLFLIKRNQLIHYCFDEVSARISGIRTSLYHFGLFFFLTLIIVSSLKISGTVLINTLLLIPGYFALKFSKNAKSIFKYSISFSLATSLIGLYTANYFNLPPGATLSVVQFVILIFLLVFKTKIRI